MSAPSITSTTVGLSLPTFSITKDLADVPTVKAVGSVQSKAKVPSSVPKRTVRGIVSRFVPIALVLVTVSMFVWYLYSVNTLEGLSFTLHNTQKQLGVKQDEQRQLQVRIAESSAHIRMQEQTGETQGFVSVGTPEFVASNNSASALTMR